MKKERILILLIIVLNSCGESSYTIIEIEKSKELISEGIAIHPRDKEIYLSSLNKDKIIRTTENGLNQEEVLSRKENGYSFGLGMDFFKEKLYALSSYERSPKSMLTIKDLNSDEIENYLNTEKDTSLFNDLTIDRKGNAYITDSKNHEIYKYDNKNRVLKSYLKSDQFYYPNGITINENETKLIVCSSTHGLRIIDIETKEIINPIHEQTKGTGIDGLKYKGGKLYFVMNSRGKNEIIRGLYSLELIANETEFGMMDELWINKELSPSPTTIGIQENRIYLLGNSQLENFSDETQGIIDNEKLENVKIIKLKM